MRDVRVVSVAILFTAAVAGCNPQGETVVSENFGRDLSSDGAVSEKPVSKIGHSWTSTEVVAGACVGPIQLVTKDADDIRAKLSQALSLTLEASSGAFYADSGCTQASTTLGFAADSTGGEIYFKSTAAGTATLTIADSKKAVVGTTLALKVNAASAGVISLVPSITSGRTGQCLGPIRLSLSDRYGNSVAASSALSVDLGGQGTGSYYVDDACTSAIQSTSFAAGASTSSVYFKGTVAGSYSLTGTAIDLVSGTGALALQASQVTLSGPTSVAQGSCSTVYTVKLADEAGNEQAAAGAFALDLTQTRSAAFYSDSSCSQAISRVRIVTGGGSPSFLCK